MNENPLDGLEDIDWTQLTHAYGKAADIPGLLQGRASDSIEYVEEAEYELYGNIHHQGTIYPATPVASRFLVRLLLREATLERPQLAVLLATLAQGNAHEPDPQNLRAQTIDAIAAHLDEYWALLDSDEGFAVTIPYLLAWLPTAHERILAEFPARLIASTSEEGRGSLAFALCVVSQIRAHGADALEPFRNDRVSTVRFAACIALALFQARHDIDFLAEGILDHLRRESLNDSHRASRLWPWAEASTYFTESLVMADQRCVRELILAMLPGLPVLDEYVAATIAHTSLPCFFDTAAVESLPTMSGIQHALLVQLARETRMGYGDDITRRIFQKLGAKTSKDLRRHL